MGCLWHLAPESHHCCSPPLWTKGNTDADSALPGSFRTWGRTSGALCPEPELSPDPPAGPRQALLGYKPHSPARLGKGGEAAGQGLNEKELRTASLLVPPPLGQSDSATAKSKSGAGFRWGEEWGGDRGLAHTLHLD